MPRRSLTAIFALAAVRCSFLYPIDELSDGADPPADPPSKSAGPTRIAVVMVIAPGSPQPDRAQVEENVFGKTQSFLLEASHGAAWIEGAVFGPFEIPPASDPCALGRLSEEADRKLAGIGEDPAGFAQIIYLHQDLGCPSALAWDQEAQRGWIRSGLRAAAWPHLLGHLLGLEHARALDCGGAALQPVSECAANETYDLFDMMGTGTEELAMESYEWGHPNAVTKERLGWLTREGAPQILEVAGSGTYTIEALETNSAGVKALTFPRPIPNGEQRFYVELRRPIGFDRPFSAGEESGVAIHLVAPDQVVLLDSTPRSSIGPQDFSDAPLVAGSSFTDPESGVVISVRELTGSTATIDITSDAPNPSWRGEPLREELAAWPEVVGAGDTITVDFDASRVRTSNDWIGLFEIEAEEDDDDDDDAAWFAPTQGRPSGRLEARAPDVTGPYELRYYRGTGTDELIAKSNRILVAR